MAAGIPVAGRILFAAPFSVRWQVTARQSKSRLGGHRTSVQNERTKLLRTACAASLLPGVAALRAGVYRSPLPVSRPSGDSCSSCSSCHNVIMAQRKCGQWSRRTLPAHGMSTLRGISRHPSRAHPMRYRCSHRCRHTSGMQGCAREANPGHLVRPPSQLQKLQGHPCTEPLLLAYMASAHRLIYGLVGRGGHT